MMKSNFDGPSDSEKVLGQLRQTLGLLQVAFDASSQITLILDANDRILWGNQPAANQWTSGLGILLPGKHFCELVTLFDQNKSPLSENQQEHPLRQSKIKDGSGRFLLKSTKDRNTSWTAFRIRWRRVTEVPGGFLLIIFSDLDPAEQALTRQQNFLNQFAHELRTPLTIISGCLQRLQRSDPANQQILEQTTTSQGEIQRISNLLDKLSLLTELDSGSYKPEPEAKSLQNLLQGWTKTLSDATSKSISFSPCTRNNYHAKLLLDQLAFNRIMSEVVENSIRFSPRESPVTISTNASKKNLTISIINSGPDIPDKELKRVFERFTKVEEYRDSHKSDGAGLGLAVARELTTLMGGSIQVRPNGSISGCTTAGCRVEIAFPLFSDDQVNPELENH